MSAYESHRLASLIPAMTDAEFAALREDIKANGLLDPIVLYEGAILDGRHRDRACEESGVAPAYVQFEGDSPVSFVMSKNVTRRNLTTDQRARIAVAALPEFEVEARAKLSRKAAAQRTAGQRFASEGPKEPSLTASDNNPSAHAAGTMAGVSASTVKRAKRVIEQAPDLDEKVAAGEMSFAKADRVLHDRVAGKPKQPKPPKAPRAERRAHRGGIPVLWEITLGWEGNADHILHHSFDLAAEVALLTPEQFKDCRDAGSRTASAIAAIRKRIPA